MTRTYVDYPWRILVTTMTSAVITTLDHRATDRQFLYQLNGPASHTGQVASDNRYINLPFPGGGSPASLTNNRRLCYALSREIHADPPYVARFGGIFMPMEDQGADAATTRYTAYDPWQYMYYRPARYPPGAETPAGDALAGLLIREDGWTYPKGSRASDIAVDMLLETEAEDGESHIDYLTDPGLIEQTDQLDAPFKIDQAQSVGEVWDNLCLTGTIDIELRAIYDPARPGKVCELRIKPKMGVVRFNTVMGWDMGDHSLLGMDRTVDRMANKVRFYAGASVAATTQTDSVSVSANGAYWAQQILGNGNHQALANRIALAELFMRRKGQRVLTFNPIADRIGYRPLIDYKLGDYIPAWASQNLREPLGVDYDAYLLQPDFPGAAGYQRIYGIPITLDDNGVERVEGLVTSQDSPVG